MAPKHGVKWVCTVIGLLLMCALPAHANDKCGSHKNAYKQGQKDGKHDAEKYRSSDPRVGAHKVAKDGYHCYEMGYEEAYAKVAREQIDSNHSSHHSSSHHDKKAAPSMEEEYFDDGCTKGRRDAEARMSMAYERHQGDYDSRFESAYKLGYERCWKESR